MSSMAFFLSAFFASTTRRVTVSTSAVRKLHADLEPVAQPLQQRVRPGQRRLPCAEQHHPAVQLLADGLGHHLHVIATAAGLSPM